MKVLHKPPRPIRVYIPKLGENHQRGGNNEIKVWRILKGPMRYEITWMLMLLKVLHKPPGPIRIFIPKSKGKGDNHNKKNIIMKLKHERFSRVQCLVGLHGG